MREASRQAETFCAGAPVRIGVVTLLPIERVVLHANCVGECLWFAAAKEPYALILRDANGLRAVAAEAESVSIETLCAEIPDLGAALATI